MLGCNQCTDIRVPDTSSDGIRHYPCGGFKNATSGDLKAAVNGIIAAAQSQTFLGITEDGHASAVTTGVIRIVS